jgi:hypothetical protein
VRNCIFALAGGGGYIRYVIAVLCVRILAEQENRKRPIKTKTTDFSIPDL